MKSGIYRKRDYEEIDANRRRVELCAQLQREFVMAVLDLCDAAKKTTAEAAADRVRRLLTEMPRVRAELGGAAKEIVDGL